jgi:hypothetical protein
MIFIPKKSLFAATVLAAGVVWAQFAATQTTESLSAEIAAQVARGVALEEVLAAAQAAGVDVAVFATAAFAAGVPVANITTAVLTQASDPAAALTTLGQVFANNSEALIAVFSSASTLPTVVIGVEAVAASIEAGCGARCLPASVVAAAASAGAASAAATAVLPPPPLASSTTSTASSGGGSGGSKPISPA